MYAPSRDIVNILPGLLRAVFHPDAQTPEQLGKMADLLAAANVPVDEKFWEGLQHAAKTYWDLQRACADSPADTLEDLMTRTGWSGVPPEHQCALMFYLGCMISGHFSRCVQAMGGRNPTIETSLNYFHELLQTRPDLAQIFLGKPPADIRPADLAKG